MSSQSFEYNLVLRIQQAEAQVEQFANRMASLLTEASNRSATAIRNQAEEAARSSENAARRSGEARVEEENRVAQIILVTQDRTASQIERTWTAMYNRIAEQARVTLGGNASNADWFRSQDRLAEINRLGEAFRREFSAEHFEPMIQALERRLRGVSGSLNRLNDPQEEYRRWTQARGETITNFTREAQEIQRVSGIANAAHDRRVAMNRQDEADIRRRAELEEQENLNNIRALELEDQKTAEVANRAIQDILRRTEQSHAMHQAELDALAQEFAAIARNGAAAQEAANNWAAATGRRGRALLAEDASKVVKYPEVDLIQRIAQLKQEDLAKDLEIVKKIEKADKDAIRAKREEESKAHKARLADIAEYESRTEDGQRRIIGEQIQADADAVRRKERLHNAVTAFQKAGLLSTEKQKDSNDKLYDRIYRGIKTAEEADAIRYARILRLDEAFRSAHSQNEADLLKLMSRRDDMSEQMFANELRRIQAIAKARLDAAKTSGWAAHNQDLSAFAGGGRTVSNMFQIQQAFEDFQYAGLRGAANNIAMMAANLGGTAGVVALMGIMGAQVSSSLGLWDKLNESLGGFLWKLKSVTEEEEKQNKLAEARLDTRIAKADQLRSYDLESYKTLEKNAAKEKDEIKTQEDILSKLQASKSAYDGMAEAANQLDTMMPRGWTLGLQSSPEESNQMLQYYKDVLAESERGITGATMLTEAQREYGKELVYSFEAAKKLWEANAGGFTLTEEGYQGVLKKIQETESNLIKMNSQHETTIWLIKNMKQAYEDISKAMSDAFKQSTSFDSSQMKGPAKDFFEEQVKARQKLVDDIQEEANKKIELAKLAHAAELEIAQNNGDIEAEKAAREKLNKVIAEQTKLINDAKNAAMQASEQARTAAEEQTADYDRLASLQKDALQWHKEELSEIEKKLNATQSLIKADEERVRVLELQKSAFEDQAGKQGVDLTVKQLQHEAELEKDAYKESAKRGKEAFLAEVERIRELARQKLEYQKRHNARGRGDSNPDVALQEQYNREKAAFDEWVTWQIKRNEEADAHNLKRIERQAELDAKAKFKEYDTAQRDKLNQLKDQADKYTSEGKLVEAGEVRKQIDKTLKDLSAAQAKMIGQGTKAEGRAAREEWEKLNAQIIENMTKEQELYKQRKAMNEEIAAEQASAVDFIKDRLEEISAIKPFDQSAMGELGGWLQQLNAIKGRMEEIVALSAAINGPNSGASSKPSGKSGLVGGGVGFAVGTDYVPETGLALIHKGEMIIPAEEAAGIRAARNSYLTPTDDSRIRSSRLLYNKTYNDANSLYSSTRKELIDSRNSGNTFAVDELENLRRAFEEFQKTMAEVNKDLSQYEEAYKKQEADRRRMAETERHNAAMAEIKESAAREKLRREESAKRIREIEAEGRKKSEEILNRGPESTPDYIARRRGEILRRRAQIERDWADGVDNADKIDDNDSFWESRGLNSKIRGAAHGIVDFQSRIVDEIEKTHEMVKEAKSKVENHPLELNKQREAAGDFLEGHGWRKKFLKRKDDTGRDPEGVYSSPQFLADEERRAKEAEKAAKIKRARAMSGMTPSENEKASVESAMQLEQNLERSAKQKALLEAMQAVKEAEVTGANELAAALERAAAAKEALAAAGNGGGYGSSAPGMGLSGGSAAGIGGGGGGGGGSSPNSLTINNNMTAHMAQASPNAVFAAMAAAAQISGIRRR